MKKKDYFWNILISTVSFTDLEQSSGMIIFESVWPHLKQASFFDVAGAVSKIDSGLKLNHHWQI